MRAVAGKKMVVIVPRLVSRLVREESPYPLGEAAWGDTVVELPADSVPCALVAEGRADQSQLVSGGDGAACVYRNIMTGEVLGGNAATGRLLPVAVILRRFPVALLEWRSIPP